METSVLVTARDGDSADRVLVDAGRGSARRIGEFLWHHREAGCAVGHDGQVEPRIDFVALTHEHFDHWGDIENFSKMYRRDWRSSRGGEATKPLFTVYTHCKTRQSLEAAGKAIGKRVMPEDLCYGDWSPEQERRCGQITLRGLLVQHGKCEGCLAFLVEAQEKRVVIAPDLDPLEEWADREAATEFREALADADLLIIGIAWWRTKDKRRLDAAKALELVAGARKDKNRVRRARLVHITHLTVRTHNQMEAELPHMCWQAGMPRDADVHVGHDGEAIAL